MKGYYGFANLGDDLLLVSLLNKLENATPDYDWKIFSNNSENNPDAVFEKSNSYLNGSFGFPNEIIDWTFKGHFDIVIDGGGGVFFDEAHNGLVQNLANYLVTLLGSRNIRILDNALRKLFGKSRGITFSKRISFAVGVGPIATDSKSLPRQLSELGSINKMYVRDFVSSVNYFRLTGLSPAGIVPDLVFGLEELYRGREISKNNKQIAIVLKGSNLKIIDYYHSLGIELQNRGYNVIFFSFYQSNDQEYIKTVSKEFEVNTWDPSKHIISDYLQNIWKSEICISDRTHGVYVAAIANVIPLIIDTGEKSLQTASSLFGDDDLRFLLTNDFFSIDSISNILNKKEVIREKVFNKVEVLKLNAKLSLDKLFEDIAAYE